jgi:magnesium chelatase subunit I
MCDLYAALPAITGKIELVYEGEQEGATIVSLNLIGKAVNKVFQKRFPAVYKSKDASEKGSGPYKDVSDFFSAGGQIEIADDMPHEAYASALSKVTGLERLARKHLGVADEEELATAMEFVLDALHQNSLVAKEALDQTVKFSDMLANMFKNMKK